MCLQSRYKTEMVPLFAATPATHGSLIRFSLSDSIQSRSWTTHLPCYLYDRESTGSRSSPRMYNPRPSMFEAHM